MDKAPATLQDAILYYSNYENCHRFMVALRWGTDGHVKCPTCGSDHVTFLARARQWKCYSKHPRPKFTLKTGTIFEDSPLPLQKWLPVMWMLVNCKNGVSSWEIHRALGVTQKTAWFMLQRCRLALQDLLNNKLGGEVEIDETFIGGLARNMHRVDAMRRHIGTGVTGKTVVIGALQRGGKVVTKVTTDRKRNTIQPFVKEHVDAGSEVHSDEHAHVWRMDEEYRHNVVNHLTEYVVGNVHTNGLENFWSCLKRSLKGTYISCEPYHLFRYVDEQAFRFNNRDMNDELRFRWAMRHIVGRRLTYAELIGKTQGAEETQAEDAGEC
jgi:transposase-like protein